MKVCAQWMVSLSTRELDTDRSKAVILMLLYLMYFSVGVSCRILYSIVSCSMADAFFFDLC